jgi:signal transduction histidine kinase
VNVLSILLALIAVGLFLALMSTVATMRGEIDERDRAYRALRVRLEEIAAQRDVILRIVEGLGEGVLAVDRQRRVVLANRRFAEMFGAGGDLVGRPLAEVTRAPAVVAAFDAALGGSEASERLSVPVGVAERRVELRAFPLPSADIAAVALFIDVTQVEALEETRRNFVSDFSHEVRTPLTGLRSAVESFDVATPEDEPQLRRIMTRQLRRLERLVDDLAELSHIETGALRLDLSDVDLRAMLDDLCEDFAERAAERNMRFALTGAGVRVMADATRIEQAFSNLLDNAIKYGASGTPIEIAVSEERGNGIVRITDHGEGIPPQDRERIFRRFYRVDKSRSQEIAGTGLGLAITKHLVLLHRGAIDVESAPGEGATFVVRLPRR